MISKRFHWIVLLLAALTAGNLRASTISWTNTSGGLWSVPANWDLHIVPRPTDSVNITAAGTYTVTADTSGTVVSLTLGGASGHQTLTNLGQALIITNMLVNANGIFGLGGGSLSGTAMTNQGTINWGGGTMAISTLVGPAATFNVFGSVTLQSALTNTGTIHWTTSGSTIGIYNNHGIYTGGVRNQAGALFDIQNDQTVSSAGYGFEFFQNAGTVRKSAGVGATSFGVAFTNTGTIDAQSGTIQFSAGGNIGGTYNTATGTTIQFTGGTNTETGTTTNTGSGLFRQNGATVVLNERITKFFLVNGNVALSPTFEGGGGIQNLQLDGAFLIGTNKVTGTLGINGGGLASASPLTVTATGVLNFNGAAVTLYAPLTNAGTVNWSGSTLSIYNNNVPAQYTGVINNQAGGFFNLQNDQSVTSAGYGFESFINGGTVRKIAGLATSGFSLPFTNTGTVDAQIGNIQFSGGGNIGGAYNTASGTTIQFTGGNYTQSGAPSVTGSGLCRQNGANVTLSDKISNFIHASGNVALTPTFQTNGTIHNLQLDGAFLTGTNKVTGTLGLNGGGVASSSPLTVATNGVLNFNGAAVTIYAPLTNFGTVNWSGSTVSVYNNNVPAQYTGAIYNQAGGLFSIQSDQSVSSAGYGFEFFQNAGTVRKIAGLGTTGFGLPFTNSGTVDAQSGVIHFTGGGNIGGVYNTVFGASIELTGGNYNETGTVTVTGLGLCRQNGANVTLNDKIANFILASGNVTLNPGFEGGGGIQNLQLDGAYLTGTNKVIGTLGFNGGGLASASPLTVTATGVLNFNGAAVTIYSPLTNAGTINWSGSTVTIYNNAAQYTGIINNLSGGLFGFQSDQSLSTAGYGFESFNNSGTVRKTAGLGASIIGVSFVNTGTLDAQSGKIQISGPYAQTGGTMNFGITSPAYYGQIAFPTSAPLTGSVSVNFNSGYIPSAGDSFPLVTYGTRTGAFTTLALPAQEQWQTNYSASTFTLSILSVSGGGLPVTITPVSLVSGKFTMQVNGGVGPSYILQASTNFTTWTNLITNTPSVMPFSVIDTNAGSFKRRFYRELLGP